jgi:hypothetical protein
VNAGSLTPPSPQPEHLTTMDASPPSPSGATKCKLDAELQLPQRFKHAPLDSPRLPPSKPIDPDQPEYGYEPLQTSQHTRILRLEPGLGDAPLRCSLLQVDTDDQQFYEAISYTWGDPEDRAYLLCDGRYITITRNLADALWYFRSPDTPKDFWADAACIDQQNISERNAQVQLMASIYSKASIVLLWLGTGDPEVVHNAFEYFKHFIDMYLQKSCELEPGSLDIPEWDEIGSHPENFPQELVVPDALSREALNQLFMSSVFLRGWVIQEFALAYDLRVCWNHSHIDVEWFYAATEQYSRTFNEFEADISSGYQGLFRLYRMRCSFGWGQTGIQFLRSLNLSSQSQFSDDRDRIYGLLAMHKARPGSAEVHAFIKADYATGKAQAFRQAAEFCLVGEKRIDTILCIHHTTSITKDGSVEDYSVNDYPSWVPDWTQWDWYRFSQKFVGAREHISISKQLRAGRECLSIRGIRCDVIQDTISTGTDQSTQALPHSPAFLSGLMLSFDPAAVAYAATAGMAVTGDAHSNSAAPALEQDMHVELCRSFIAEELQRQSISMERNSQGFEPPGTIKPHGSENAREFALFYWRMTSQRLFFKTANGMLGLGPKSLRAGDVVVVLFGESEDGEDGVHVAAVLRPVGGLWRLVGACFLYEVMTGRVYDEWKKSGEPPEDFCIY